MSRSDKYPPILPPLRDDADFAGSSSTESFDDELSGIFDALMAPPEADNLEAELAPQTFTEMSALEEIVGLEELLEEAVQRGASDIHLTTDRRPVLRIAGQMRNSVHAVLDEGELARLIDETLTEEQRKVFAARRSLTFSMIREGLGFFRLHLYTHLGRPEAAIRVGPTSIPDPAELGTPPELLELVRRTRGLVLITGPTGVGKTTTLNAIVGRISRESRRKVVTIEDPVEYVHPQARSVVVQQEVGLDVPTFAEGVRRSLRQDPDVLVIGDLRDLETIQGALDAAEAGHMVLATLPTPTALGSVSRLLDVFPPDQKQHVQVKLASALHAVLSQRLLPRQDGRGRLLVYDFLVMTDAARAMVREGKTVQLQNVIETGQTQGMQSIDRMIRGAVRRGYISYETAVEAVSDLRKLEGVRR